MKVYSLSSQAKLNTVPNTLVICCEIACYDRICEGCESKKSKIAVCAYTRARDEGSPIERKEGENQDEGEGQKRERVMGDKNVRAISKNVGEKRKTWEIFQKT